MLRNSGKFILFTLCLLFSLSAQADAVLNALFHGNDPVAGNPKGNVTIVEFFDYQCGHCINMASVIQSVIRSDRNVRVVFKEFPIRGAASELASRAALAANLQGKYYALSHALLTTSDPLTEATVFSIAQAQGLNINKLKKDMQSPYVSNIIAANKKLAAQLGIPGTPAFFIGKTNATDTNDVKYELGELSSYTLQKTIKQLSS